MSRNPILKGRRDNLIRENYRQLANEYVLGQNGRKVPKWRHEAILARLSAKFFLSEEYIALLLRQEDVQLPENQLDMFKEEK